VLEGGGGESATTSPDDDTIVVARSSVRWCVSPWQVGIRRAGRIRGASNASDRCDNSVNTTSAADNTADMQGFRRARPISTRCCPPSRRALAHIARFFLGNAGPPTHDDFFPLANDRKDAAQIQPSRLFWLEDDRWLARR